MSDHGILFKEDMTAAIREGRKTETRRLSGLERINAVPDHWELVAVFQDGLARFGAKNGTQEITCKARYAVGDRLYVKEAVCYDCEDSLIPMPCYKLDRETNPASDFCDCWKSPMFMPKRFARTWGTVTEVRAQRLQDTSPADMVAEGFPIVTQFGEISFPQYINSLDDGAWDKNLWAFAYTIKWD